MAKITDMILGGPTGQQAFIIPGVAQGTPIHRSPYTALTKVAYAPFDAFHRTFTNLFHPQPPTAAATPRPDATSFIGQHNWPPLSRLASGVAYQIFEAPRGPTLKGTRT